MQFDDNSTLKVPASEKVRPESISKNTKPRPSHFVSTAVDTRDNFSLKKTSNAPRSDIINDPSLNATARVRNKASLNWVSA